MSQPDFTFGERVGLLFTVEGASLSICAVTIILFYALFKWVRTWRNSDSDESEASDSILFLNLMLADLIQGIGTMPSAKWMKDAKITEGELCTTQAVLKQVGINGVAMTSLAIALYTFIVLVMRKERMIPTHTSKVVVVIIWIITSLVVGISKAVHKDDDYYGPTQFWCWIKPTYLAAQIVTEYLWVWLAAVVMLVLYSIMFLLMRGWIGEERFAGPVENHEMGAIRQIGICEQCKQGVAEDQPEQQTEAEITKKVAQKMLYYPVIYIACILPNSISRWMTFKGRHPPSKFVFAANTIFALSGLFNFILFFITRRSWVTGGNNRGESRQRTGGGRTRRPHGLAPSSRPSSPQIFEKGSESDDDYSQQPRASLTLPPEQQPSTSRGFLPPGRP